MNPETELYDDLVEWMGEERQLNQAVEEFCEVAVALRHLLRNRPHALHEVLKELAQADIMARQAVRLLGAEDRMAVVRAGELARLRERLINGELA